MNSVKQAKANGYAAQPLVERVMLVGVRLDQDVNINAQRRTRLFELAMAEAEELVWASGGKLVEAVQCKRQHIHSALYVGSGKAEELAQKVSQQSIDLVVFNHTLTPTQERNLEKALKCRVLDRVGLILAIFARRAQSQEGRL